MKFRKHGPGHIDDLHLLFDKVHVTGGSASCPRDHSSNELSDEDVMEIAASEKPKVVATTKKRKHLPSMAKDKEDRSPFFWMYMNTCMNIESVAEKMTSNVEASSTPPQANLVPTIAHAMKMVKECDIEEKAALMNIATSLILKSKFRGHFLRLK